MHLPEHDLLLGPKQGAPGPDAALESTAHADAEVGMAACDLLEDRHRAQAGRGLEHGHDLAVPHANKRVGPAAATGHLPG